MSRSMNRSFLKGQMPRESKLTGFELGLLRQNAIAQPLAPPQLQTPKKL